MTIPLCALAIRPYVEMGIGDDWSYVKTAQVLAQTGHVVYNGWATAMLGWQVVLAALFIKLFGFSFAVARATTVFVAMATAFLAHRIFVRLGVGDWNAAIGTLTLVLSPDLLPLVFTFMTDVGGLFCVLVCLYTCLRALQSETASSAIAWLVVAASLNAVGGTVRQIVWLGVLIMFPSTLWLLRRQRQVLWAGVALYFVSIAFVCAAMQWFKRQPYSVPEPLLRGDVGSFLGWHLPAIATRTVLDLSFFLLPVLLAFVGGVRRDRRAVALLAAGGVVCLGFYFVLSHRQTLANWLFPYIGRNISLTGLIDRTDLHGDRPVLLTTNIRLFLSTMNLAGLLCFLAVLFDPRPKRPLATPKTATLSWPELNVLIVPFTVAYFLLLLSRTPFQEMYDRYLYPLLFIALLLLMRLFQQKVSPRLPVASLLLALAFAGYSVAAMHDTFEIYRARLAAVNELRSAGIPATEIDGGFEYNAWTQIERVGYANERRIQVPPHAFRAVPRHLPGECYPFIDEVTPAVDGRYALAFDPDACHGKTAFAPVTFHSWFGAHASYIYIVDGSHP